MTSGDKLFGRLLKRTPPAAHELPDPLGSPATGLHLYLNDDGDVLQMAGPLRHLLAQFKPQDQPLPLSTYLLPHSTLTIEGRPREWLGLLLDLDFSVSPSKPCTCVAGYSRWATAG